MGLHAGENALGAAEPGKPRGFAETIEHIADLADVGMEDGPDTVLHDIYLAASDLLTRLKSGSIVVTEDPAGVAYEGWAIVELMGHRQTTGKVAEVQAAVERRLVDGLDAGVAIGATGQQLPDVLTHAGSLAEASAAYFGALAADQQCASGRSQIDHEPPGA